MKKAALSLALAASALPGFALADNGPGCGIGTQIFKGQSGLFAHTLAATTNGSTFNQLFGLTSGTLDCNPANVVSNEFERVNFVAANLDNLSQEMAQGGGSHVQALAALYDIAPADRAQFYELTQREMPQLLDSSKNGAQALLVSLNTAMNADPVLAKYSR
ncbi:MAG TPA: DUF3015 domain-containing protein [Gammaproteobacteria bacterium]|nr:DUF3015 domain-containing protein [Gammaproteobacteria bacterium]